MEKEYINCGTWRTGRRDYKCYKCKQPIPKGERHWEDWNETLNYQTGDRYCANCATELTEMEDYSANCYPHPRPHILIALASPDGPAFLVKAKVRVAA